MTDKLKGFVIQLDEQIREDDARPIIEAIKMIKHVANVIPMVCGIDHLMAVDSAKRELIQKIYEVLK